jgi:3-hydroxy-5-methyl-1-naphthoate 3-O-methyltransferase
MSAEGGARTPDAGGGEVARLMQLASGFWVSNVLAAAVELGVFGLLDSRPALSADEAAQALGIAARGVRQLLPACASLGLLAAEDGRYSNSALADRHLVPGRPGYFGGFVRFRHAREYAAWGRLTEALRTDLPTAWDPGDERASVFAPEDESLRLFWEGAHPLSVACGEALARALDLSATRTLLDVGGGTGACAIGLCRHLPELRVTVYELPFVAELARAKVTEAGMEERITVVDGDFLAEPDLPAGHDTVLLSSVLHNWDPATVATLLAKCHRALLSAGTVIITELILDDGGAGPPGAALMGLDMLVWTLGGRSYTESEHRAALAAAGFVDVRAVPLEVIPANLALAGRRP